MKLVDTETMRIKYFTATRKMPIFFNFRDAMPGPEGAKYFMAPNAALLYIQ